MRISKTETREIRLEQDGPWMVLIERERGMDTGGRKSRYQWHESRVCLTREELAKAL